MLLHHITLLTGHITTHRLDTIDPGAVAACRALLPDGGPIPGFPAFRVEITEALFTIWRGQEPIATCAIGHATADDSWAALAALQARFGPVTATPPKRGPWLAVALLPGIANLTREDIGWLSDFERCLAVAILLPSGGR